jgi:DNA-binding NtrC family response regulator
MQTILIVDDEPAIRALLEIALHRAGFSVLTAGCGCEAISISESHRGEIALLITDITLPGMTGWSLARAFTQDDPEMPVLFISGGCIESNFDASGRSEFLPKPFLLSKLITEVQTLLTGKSQHQVS